MVMSINRLVLGGGGLKTESLCQDRHAAPLTLCHIGSRLSSLPPFPSFFVFLHADSLLSQSFSEPFTGDSLSDSAALHHAHTLAAVASLPLATPGIWVFCLSSVYPSTLLHLHLSPLNLSHFFSLALVLLPPPHGVIARSPASIFMTIIEARMLMPLDFSLPVSQQQQQQAEEGR